MIMKKKYNVTKNQMVGGFALVLALCVVFLLVFKAQLNDSFNKKNECTLMWEHKENGSEELSAEKTSLTQVFTCTVPELKTLKIECKGKEINPDTYIEISVTEPGSGEVFYHKKSLLQNVVNDKKKKISIKMKNAITNSENKQLILNISLLYPSDSRIKFTANNKAGIVTSFDGVKENKTNVIYALQYSNTNQLKVLYFFLCILLLAGVVFSYYLIVVCRKTVEQFFIPIALIMGFIVQCVIVVYGVPDEPWHMDTAYKLSNVLLRIDDSSNPGTLLKRQCDIIMSDMLANGAESNSYYQLLEHTFEKPENVELINTTFVDSSNLVPDFIFLPTAIGISIGRMLGLSALLTMQLGRLCNLLCFVMLVWLAIKQMPYGKNVMAAIALTPIALQQASSASYDPVITGIVFLFIATVLRIVENSQFEKKDILITLILIVLLGMVKGGVYLPLISLLLCVCEKIIINQQSKTIKKKWILVGAGVVGMVLVALLYKFKPTFLALLSNKVEVTGSKTIYSLSYILEHPADLVYLYWNTIFESGEGHLAGMLGGRLGWHDVQISWMFVVIILICLLLFVNVRGDQYSNNVKCRIYIGIGCLISTVLIMLSMLLGVTTLDDTHIAGIQGRYFLPFAPILFMLTTNHMLNVNQKQCKRIWMALIITDVLVVLQFVVKVL